MDNTWIWCLKYVYFRIIIIIMLAFNQLYSLKVAACILVIMKDLEEITEYF